MTDENPYKKLYTEKKAEAAREDQRINEERERAQQQAADEANRLAEPLTTFLLPELELAKAGLAAEGVTVEILPQIEPKDRRGSPPSIFFRICKGKAPELKAGVWFNVAIEFLQGGVKCNAVMGLGTQNAKSADVTTEVDCKVLNKASAKRVVDFAIEHHVNPNKHILRFK